MVLAKDKIRHFPLVEGKERLKENIVGIMDIGEVAAMGLLNAQDAGQMQFCRLSKQGFV